MCKIIDYKITDYLEEIISVERKHLSIISQVDWIWPSSSNKLFWSFWGSTYMEDYETNQTSGPLNRVTKTDMTWDTKI